MVEITINKKCDKCNTIIITKKSISKHKKLITYKCDNCGRISTIKIDNIQELLIEVGKLSSTLDKIDNEKEVKS